MESTRGAQRRAARPRSHRPVHERARGPAVRRARRDHERLRLAAAPARHRAGAPGPPLPHAGNGLCKTWTTPSVNGLAAYERAYCL
jgi:hypothetical protein